MLALRRVLRRPNRVFIAVMGPTGAGKTSFINRVSGSSLRVGQGLQSETDRIGFSKPFLRGQQEITLIDTPGFDDTIKSDAEILIIISDFLKSIYLEKQPIHGVIYLHRITDNRMGGTALRNLRMFWRLCGDEAMPNCVLVLNMWHEVKPEVRAAREEELRNTDIFFKPAVDAGAQIFHHDDTKESAGTILDHFAGRSPRPLLIQRELVDDQKRIFETSAGVALLGDLAVRERKQLEQLQEMQQELEEIRQEEERRELEVALERVQINHDKLLREQQRLQDSPQEPKQPEPPRAGLYVTAWRFLSENIFRRRWYTGSQST